MLPLDRSPSGLVRPAELSVRLEGNRVRCVACGLRCPIPAGFAGVCKVRMNRGGILHAPAGYVHSTACDPIEKKPFFHVLPGSYAFSFGMLGCNLHCGYCQNWVSSQTLRDFRATTDLRPTTPARLVAAALAEGAAAMVSTYNEPLITAEWAVQVFREAKAAGLLTGFVSNGNATPEVLDYLRPHLDVIKVDLKSFDDRRYHELGCRLAPILDSIQRIHALGFWLEVVTLVVPGFNDSDDELSRMAGFLAGISGDIPWHLSAFHPDYKMQDPPPTPAAALERAVEIGRTAGLRYVYAGNLPRPAAGLEETKCPGCGTVLIERRGFRVRANRIGGRGLCPDCGIRIPGVWAAAVPPRPASVPLLHRHCG